MGRYRNEQGDKACPISNTRSADARDRFTNALNCQQYDQAGEGISDDPLIAAQAAT